MNQARSTDVTAHASARPPWRPRVRAVTQALVAASAAALVLAVAGCAPSDDGAQPSGSATTAPPSLAPSGPTPGGPGATGSDQDPPTGDPQPPPRAGEPDVSFKNVSYCSNEGIDLQLDFFRPPVSTPTPLLVYIHGGGWSSGNKSQLKQRPVFQPLLDAGYSLASVNYRTSPEFAFPAHIIDVKCAVRHLRANAADYNVDPDRIAVMGFSSGAHLAMLVGVTDADDGFDVGQYGDVSSAVSAVIEIDGPPDIAALTTLPPEIAAGVFLDSTEVMTQASPLTYLDGGDPPTLIIHGELDQTVPVEQAQLLDDRLTELGVEHSTIIVEDGGHRFPTEPSQIAAMIDFLNAHLA